MNVFKKHLSIYQHGKSIYLSGLNTLSTSWYILEHSYRHSFESRSGIDRSKWSDSNYLYCSFSGSRDDYWSMSGYLRIYVSGKVFCY